MTRKSRLKGGCRQNCLPHMAATELERLTRPNRRYKVARARPMQEPILPHISKSPRAAKI